MEKTLRIVVDAMGGDNFPQAPVEGAVQAVKASEGFEVILAGKEEILTEELKKYGYTGERIRIRDCREVIEMAEPPVHAIQTKKDSSIVAGLSMLRKGEADAFVSAGSTGAVIAGAQVIVGRIKGIRRSPLATLIPTEKGVSLLIDCGANVDARPEQLIQFAQMGSIYMENVLHIKEPSVGIVNIGAEDEKGNALVKETIPLLRERKDIRFVGSVEARDIPAGGTDVIVTEAFTGNVILKMYEGTASMFKRMLSTTLKSSVRGMIGGALVKPLIKKALSAYDASEHGGAPLLGLKGLVVKTHGNSKAAEIRNSILQCRTFYEENVNGKIEQAISGGEA
ncbi:MAG: phosphate acyltransferase PlsX [Lachnospiraceae bacterium]|nr:phosphate acyltransferase PlsX [Lachnospiraceae bacterium]